MSIIIWSKNHNLILSIPAANTRFPAGVLHVFNKPPLLLNRGLLGRLFSLSTIGLNKFFGREDPPFFCEKV